MRILKISNTEVEVRREATIVMMMVLHCGAHPTTANTVSTRDEHKRKNQTAHPSTAAAHVRSVGDGDPCVDFDR